MSTITTSLPETIPPYSLSRTDERAEDVGRNPVISSNALFPGDHLSQAEFHSRYESYPENVRLELIQGVVVMPAAASNRHADEMSIIKGWILAYRAATPGKRSFADGTTVLGPDDEVQPDAALVVLPEYGGQIRFEGKYISGPPEFIAEVAITSANYDLHSKRAVYEKSGVQEYVVVVVSEDRVVRFTRDADKLIERPADSDGIHRSRVFPGLWLNVAAAISRDAVGVLATLQAGLATPEHQAFAAKLASRRTE